MNKFKFSASGVLRHKEWLEREATRLLGVELNTLQTYRDALIAIDQDREKLIQSRQDENQYSHESHLAYIQFDNKLKMDIVSQNEKIKVQQQVIEKSQTFLNNAVTEKKKIEKLRERELSSYNKTSKSKETSRMDEISSNFYDKSPETL